MEHQVNVRPLLTFRPRSLDILRELAALPGAVASLGQIEHSPLYLATKPQAVHQILVGASKSFRRWSFGSGKAIFGNGILNSHGEPYMEIRKREQPAFRGDAMADWNQAIEAISRPFLEENLSGETDQDAQRLFNILAMRIVARLLFSVDISDATADAIYQQTIRLEKTYAHRDASPEAKRQFDDAVQVIDHHFANLLQAQPEALSKGSIFRMLAAQPAFSKAQIFEEFRGLTLAGTVTTAHLLATTCWLLAHHPDQQLRTREAADARDDKWIDAVFFEGLRLYPPIWVIGRQVTEPVTMGDREHPVGTRFLISPWLLHHTTFDRAEDFFPERWLRGEEPEKGSYLPFALGLHSCIGSGLAMMEAHSILKSVLSRWMIHPSKKSPTLDLKPSLLLRPFGGIWVSFQKNPL